MCALIIFSFFVFVQPCFAMTLLTEREALKFAFGEDSVVTSEKKVLSGPEAAAVMARLGGKMDTYQKGRNVGDLRTQREFTFYFAEKDGKRYAAAVILDASGKWGPIQFFISVGLDAKVRDVLVMRYTETRGRPIARRSFLSQFSGKTSRDAFVLNKDVVAISGATISSHAAAFTVKKAIVLYEELYLKSKGGNSP